MKNYNPKTYMPVKINKAREVKKKYESKWLTFEEVTAVGIAITSTGDVGIIISVKKNSRRIKKKIPKEIDGVPIQIQETGEIKAL